MRYRLSLKYFRDHPNKTNTSQNESQQKRKRKTTDRGICRKRKVASYILNKTDRRIRRKGEVASEEVLHQM